MGYGDKPRSTSRRQYLKTTGVIVGGSTVGLAGCTGNGQNNGEGTTEDENGGGQQETHDWIIGTSYPVGHILNEGFIDWADEINEETGGRIDITIEEQLDGEFEMLEQVSFGAIEGVSMGSGWIVEFGNGALFVASPYIYDSWEENLEGYDNPIFDEAVQNLRDRGNQVLLGGPIYRGARQMTSNTEVNDLAGLDGIDMRLPEVDEWVRIWSSLGVNPTTVAFDELYSALQTGVVDAQENPVQTISSMGLPEVQDYLIRTGHVFAASWMGINEAAWERLSEDDKTLMRESIETKSRELDEEIMQQEQEIFDELEDEGMTIIDPDLGDIRDAALEEAEAMFEDGTFRGDPDEILG